MAATTTPTAISCSACGGDPRLAARCKMCGGAGIGVLSVDSFCVWGEDINTTTMAARTLQKRARAAFHLILLACGLVSIAFFVWHASQIEDVSLLRSREFWFSGHWTITLLWLSVLFDCFLIFRLVEYTKLSRELPGWGRPKSKTLSDQTSNLKARTSTVKYRFDVAPYFSPSAREVVENAYRLARNMERGVVTPNTLCAAALASPAGALFLLRLGAPFERLKGPLARLLQEDGPGAQPIFFSSDAKRALVFAYIDAREHQRKYVSPMEIFLQSFHNSPRMQTVFDQLGYPLDHIIHVAEWIRLNERLREDQERFVVLASLKPKSAMNRSMTARHTPLLNRYSEDLTLVAREGFLAPIVGREEEMEALLRAVEGGRRSVVLIGEAGVGKTALIEQLARRMVEEDVPQELFDRRLVSIDVAQLLAAGDPSLAPERFLSILQEAALSGNAILAMRGIEALTGSGSGGPMDLSEILATELDKGYFIVIATTTPQSWSRYLERRTLATHVTTVDVPELNAEDTLRVCMARCGAMEYRTNVFFSFASLRNAATLADRYVHDLAAPEKALHLIREAAVLARKERGEHTIVSAEDVARVVHGKTHIPVETLSRSESTALLQLEEKLHGRVIGQNAAVVAVSQALRRARAELREGKRPIANFLFLGPTGVGKTELAKSLAAGYFSSEDAMIRLDMSEYQDASSFARMIGAPGDERGGLLTEAVRHQPFALLLLDELEKAHPDILNLFLQVMDDGRLTDGIGRTVDFTNVLLIATSNAGTPYIQSEVSKGTPVEVIKTALLERELKGIFRPEFLNRFDGIIVFQPLTLDDVFQIAWLMLNHLSRRLQEQRGVTLQAEDEAVEELARAGFDPLFGARPLRRVIQERVENGIADLLLREKVGRKDVIFLTAGGALRLTKAPEV